MSFVYRLAHSAAERRGRRVHSLRIGSQRKVYGIRAVPCEEFNYTLEILIEQWSTEVMTCLGMAGEESTNVSFSLTDTQKPMGCNVALERKIYSQESFDHDSVITDLSHGDVNDIFAQIRLLLKGQILAPTLGPRHEASAAEFDEVLFAVMLEADNRFWEGRKLPSLHQIFAKSMEGRREA